MSGILSSIAFFFVLSFVVSAINGDFFRDMMRDTSNIRPNAEIVHVEPKKAGFSRGSHFEVEIKFDDGSRYRTSLGKTRMGHEFLRGKYVEISYNEPDLRAAIMKAIEAHDSYIQDIAEHGPKNQTLVELTQGIPWSYIVFGAFAMIIYILVFIGILYGCQAILG